MEQVTKTNLPIVGRIQHGMQQIVNQRKRVTELGYFIAKTKNDNMNLLLTGHGKRYYIDEAEVCEQLEKNNIDIENFYIQIYNILFKISNSLSIR